MERRPFLGIPQLRQHPLWTQTVPPQSEQVHFALSHLKNSLIPESLMSSRFSIGLIRYLVRYRLSRCFRASHGKSPHSKQYFAFPSRKASQVFILHLMRVTHFSEPSPRQPGHEFVSLKWALHTPQLMPHGAIIVLLNVVMVLAPARGDPQTWEIE